MVMMMMMMMMMRLNYLCCKQHDEPHAEHVLAERIHQGRDALMLTASPLLAKASNTLQHGCAESLEEKFPGKKWREIPKGMLTHLG